MTLPAYIATRFLSALLRVLAIVFLLVFVVEFVETMRSLADKTDKLGDVAKLSLLAMPAKIDQMLPLIMLLSSLTLFVGLSRSSELVVTRAAGVSAIKMVTVPVIVSLLIGIVTVAAFNPIVAAASRSYDIVRDEIVQTNRSVLSVSQSGLWLRQVVDDRQTVVFARRSSPGGQVLFDTEFHVFDEAGALQERILADSARLQDQAWDLRGLRRWQVRGSETDQPNAIVQLDEAQLPTNLTSDQILDSFAPPQTISVWQLPKTIQQLEQSGFTAVRHKIFLQTSFALPLMFVAMVLIGAGFTMRHVRFGKTGIMVLLSVLGGFTLFSFASVANSLGAAGNIPIAIAAWAPPIASILLTVGLLLHLEDG